MKSAGWKNDGISWGAENSPLSHVEKKSCPAVGFGVFYCFILEAVSLEV